MVQFPAAFRLSCDPRTKLATWEGALWRPEIEADDVEEFVNGMEAFFSVLFPLARRLKLDIYDAMRGVYLPARGLALPPEEGWRYRLDFDPDAEKGEAELPIHEVTIPGLVKKAAREEIRDQDVPISWVVPPRFDDTDGFFNGLARVKVNGKWGYINEKGEEIVPPRFDAAEDFATNGLAWVSVDDKWGLVNERGEEIVPPRFVNRTSSNKGKGFTANGLAKVEANDKYGYINTRGEEVIPLRFGNAGDFSDNGLARVATAINYKWGYINEKGEEVIPMCFDYVEDFAANGLARAKINGKYGYIDEKGEIVIPPRFDLTWKGNFAANGLAQVRENGKWLYIIAVQFNVAHIHHA
jgi:hypothetical protein